jgi:hypothetical protein
MATRASGSRTSTSFYLVTARHNVENAERLSDLYLRANLKAGGAEIVRLDGQWHYPDNEASDVAVIPLGPGPSSISRASAATSS